MILLLFTILSLAFTCKSSLKSIETSSFGLKASNFEELQSWLMRFYLKPEDRHIFYSIMKSTYFDYSQILYSICESVNDKELFNLIADLKSNDFNDEIVADCICIANKNGSLQEITNLPVNPVLSKHFNSNQWTFQQIKTFSTSALKKKYHKIRWNNLISGDILINDEYADFFFESNYLWRTIQYNFFDFSVKSETIIAFIENLVKDHIKSAHLMLAEDIKVLMGKFILIGSIVKYLKSDESTFPIQEREFVSIRTNNLITQFIEIMRHSEFYNGMFLYKLIIHLNDPKAFPIYRFFIKETLKIIESICTPAIILNFIYLFLKEFKTDYNLFEEFSLPFFNNFNLTPTVQETCSLIKLSKKQNKNIIDDLILSKVKAKNNNNNNLLQSVYIECSESIPSQSIIQNFPLQIRLQTVLRKHRKLIHVDDCALLIELPFPNQPPRDRLLRIVGELDSLNQFLESTSESSFNGFKAYNYPVYEHHGHLGMFMKKSFVTAIDYFFDSFLKCDSFYHVIEEDVSIIPNLITLNPKLMESFGYFMASSIILQHPLKFKLNLNYFNLMRSNYKAQFHQFLFEVYPQNDLKVVSWSILSEHLQVGIEYFNNGFVKAFEADHFSLHELYKLIQN